ncbi:MAG: polysaccharide deacetylase family protein [Candidatus Woesearchaeota archaeon]
MKGCVNVDMDTLCEDLVNKETYELRSITYKKMLPKLLKLLRKHDIPATFFVIGKDCGPFKGIIKNLAKDYEIGNHSYSHNKQLVNLGYDRIFDDIKRSHESLVDASGQEVAGFRAPGYTINNDIIIALKNLNYKYDSSLNTSIVYYLLKKSLKLKYGKLITTQKFHELLFKPKMKGIVEIPINKYLGYPLMSASLFFNYKLSKKIYPLIRKQTLNYAIHATEFFDNEIRFEGGISSGLFKKIPYQKRILYFEEMLKYFKENYELKTMKEIAKKNQ